MDDLVAVGHRARQWAVALLHHARRVPAAPARPQGPGQGLRALTARARGILRRLPAPLTALFFVTPATRARQSRTERPVVTLPAQPPVVRIIANPVSGIGHGPLWRRQLDETLTWLGQRGLPAELCLTDGPGSARYLTEQAVRAGQRMVVAAGGDGTINEIIQALAHHPTALGVLPLGTVNVWAREMNIPLALPEARAVLVDGLHRRIDLGRAGTRYFLLMAGIGIDAETARRVQHHELPRRELKVLDYIATGGLLSVTQRPARVRVQCDGRRRRREAVQILIGNTRLWGGAFTFTPRAVVDDSWLDVVFVEGLRLRHRAQVFLRAALHRPSLGPHARYERVQTLHLAAQTPLPVQVDGEVVGVLPMTFSVAPRALTVIVPATAPRELFIHAPLAGRARTLE